MTIPLALAVYCGSRPGSDPRHRAASVRLGEIMARSGIALVYGGGSVGLMGALADTVLREGGRAIGVIPRFLLEREVGHLRLSEQHVVETMHERKMRMFDLADAYVVLPGGIGTLEELFEVLSWRVLGLHDKPIVVVDEADYWTPLRNILGRLVEGGFADQRHAGLVHFVPSVEDVLVLLATIPAPARTPGIAKA